MADTKISALTELAAVPDNDDLLVIVDDPAGTPATKKITVANMLGSAPRVLSTSSPSAVASLDITLPSGYEIFELVGWIQPATDDDDVFLRFNDGSGFDSTNEYEWGGERMDFSVPDVAVGAATAAGEINLSLFGVGSAANEYQSFTARIMRAKDAAHTYVDFRGTKFNPAAGRQTIYGGGMHTVAAALTEARILCSTGNIANGEVRLIGIA